MSEFPLSSGEMAKLMQLARTDAGQQLIRYLKQSNGPALRNAAQQAAAGNYETAKQIAKDLLASPEARDLLKKLGR